MNLLVLDPRPGFRAALAAAMAGAEVRITDVPPTLGAAHMALTTAGDDYAVCFVPAGLLEAVGGDLVGAMRALAPEMVVLLTDADADGRDLALDALAWGADDALVGDFDRDRLRVTIDAHLHWRRRRSRYGTATTVRRALVVERPDAGGAVGAALQQAGYQVFAAGDGYAAVELLRHHQVHVAVADVDSEGLGGAALVDAVRRYDPTLVVLAMAALGRHEAALEAVEAGAFDFLTLPAQDATIASMVERAWTRWALGEDRRHLLHAELEEVTEATGQALIFEDHPGHAFRIQEVLEGDASRTWSCDVVATIDAGLGLIASRSYELIVFDLSLTGADAVGDFLRVLAQAPDAPALVLTGPEQLEDARRCVQCGAQEYLLREWLGSPAALERVRYALERQRTLAHLDRLAQEVHASDTSRLSILGASADAALIVDERSVIQFVNAAGEALLGRPARTMLGATFPHPLEPGRVAELELKQGGVPVTVRAHVAEVSWEGRPARLATLRDVTDDLRVREALRKANIELREARRRIEDAAFRDPLTGLLNRRGFEAALFREVERARAEGDLLVAVLVDCDDFKKVNDTLGHAVGDVVLVEIARRLRTHTGEVDVVGRAGGDEFLVLMPGSDLGRAQLAAERLRLAIGSEPIQSGHHAIRVTASLGVATLEPEILSIEDLLTATHEGLKASKQQGKNRVGWVRSKKATRSTDEIRRIVEALRGGHVRTLAQPIFQLSDERVVAHEMMSRGPSGPFELPVDFFRLSSAHNIQAQVDVSCLRLSVEAGRELGLTGRIHVNVFEETLGATRPEELLEVVGELPAGGLCLEIVPDGSAPGDKADLRAHLATLREAGVVIALDSVRFGRSALEDLVLLEPDVMKVHRSLLALATEAELVARPVRRLASVAGYLGVAMIGVALETRDELEAARQLGVTMGQGKLWQLPL